MTPENAGMPDKADAALDALLEASQDEVLVAISQQATEQPDYLDALLDARLQAANDELLHVLKGYDSVFGPIAAARVAPPN
ncbi:hypothetical protein GA0074695_6467 [Micromonospora viridifaciens]|uniref:Uncharacterized protein n=1 Tax=Micromonospora viridifaciens TaxID=1881 RepID=A0A1C5A169_MICVI|nr:hypothetical protein [Micromonospora viridifaciens]SCF38967.1 hypothetical protein GA0074695_6467 [Micromonospora viridifaciens]